MSDQHALTEEAIKNENFSTLLNDQPPLNQSYATDYREFEQNSIKSHSSLVDISNGVSQIEQAILGSHNPIDIQESEEITVNGYRGVWANKSEVGLNNLYFLFS